MWTSENGETIVCPLCYIPLSSHVFFSFLSKSQLDNLVIARHRSFYHMYFMTSIRHVQYITFGALGVGVGRHLECLVMLA
jgi:hypothetical protein